MNLAKISSNGQITVPVEIRRQLGLKSGDKILFLQKPDGEIVISNASAQAIRKAQAAFSGVAEEIGVLRSEDADHAVPLGHLRFVEPLEFHCIILSSR